MIEKILESYTFLLILIVGFIIWMHQIDALGKNEAARTLMNSGWHIACNTIMGEISIYWYTSSVLFSLCVDYLLMYCASILRGDINMVSSVSILICFDYMQCKITLGGNLAATIVYRETALPLLLTDAKLTFAGADGLREYSMDLVFRERLLLPRGEFLAGVTLGKNCFELPYFHAKKTRNEKIDYPLITVAGLKKDGKIRIAFSGLASYPFRDAEVENILNSPLQDPKQKAKKAADTLRDRIQSDLSGSAEYRQFVLQETILNILDTMKGV